MEKVVLQAALTHYPKKQSPTQVPTQPQDLANSARHMWQLFRQMRSQRFTAQGVLQARRLWYASHRRTVYTSRDPSLDPRYGEMNYRVRPKMLQPKATRMKCGK